jgi:regulatory protein YycI of two-component signal transduction system YycFG
MICVGEEDAAWMVYVVYFVVDLFLVWIFWNWRILYVPEVFEEDAEAGWQVGDGLGRSLSQ